jgi:hypothetical protein
MTNGLPIAGMKSATVPHRISTSAFHRAARGTRKWRVPRLQRGDVVDRSARVLYQRPVTFEPQTTEAIREMPDVVYSVAHSDIGLALADQLTAALPPGVPLVQYFLDYLMSPGLGSDRYLRRVLARADEVWALTEEIADAVGRVAAKFGKSVRVQPGFHLDLPAVWKQTHRAAGASDFTPLSSAFAASPGRSDQRARYRHRSKVDQGVAESVGQTHHCHRCSPPQRRGWFRQAG